jgi:putative oxidoreductase
LKERQIKTRIAVALTWLLAILLALVFAAAGGAKLVSRRGMVQEFAQLGFGQWLRYFTGILEVTAAIALLIPRIRFFAALQLAVIMAAATIANLSILHLPGMARLTVVLLALALALAWLSRLRANNEYRTSTTLERREASDAIRVIDRADQVATD